MNADYHQNPQNDFDSLSFQDLLEARDAYHVHLMNYPHVTATAVGRYRIRIADSWPEPDGTVKHKGTGARTLGNSEVRPYSWPAILVFVACQPLHISYLHDGDPEQPQTRTIHHRNGTEEEIAEPLGAGVHSAYENAMVSAHRGKVLDGLEATPKVKATELIESGLDAAKATIAMMRTVFKRVPPRRIVQFYIGSDAKPKQLAEDMWAEFGAGTRECMRDGVHLLAVLWQSAWAAGEGDQVIPASALKALTRQKVMKICQDEDFLPSVSVGKIKDVLKEPV